MVEVLNSYKQLLLHLREIYRYVGILQDRYAGQAVDLMKGGGYRFFLEAYFANLGNVVEKLVARWDSFVLAPGILDIRCRYGGFLSDESANAIFLNQNYGKQDAEPDWRALAVMVWTGKMEKLDKFLESSDDNGRFLKEVSLNAMANRPRCPKKFLQPISAHGYLHIDENEIISAELTENLPLELASDEVTLLSSKDSLFKLGSNDKVAVFSNAYSMILSFHVLRYYLWLKKQHRRLLCYDVLVAQNGGAFLAGNASA